MNLPDVSQDSINVKATKVDKVAVAEKNQLTQEDYSDDEDGDDPKF